MDSGAAPVESAEDCDGRAVLSPDSVPQCSAKRLGMDDGEGSENNINEAPMKKRRIATDCGELPVLLLDDDLGSTTNSNNMLDGNQAFGNMDFEDLSSAENSVLGLEDGELEDEEADTKDSIPETKESLPETKESLPETKGPSSEVAQSEATPTVQDGPLAANAEEKAIDAPETETEPQPRRRPFAAIKCHQGPPPPEDALPEVTEMLEKEREEEKAEEERKLQESRLLEEEKRAAAEGDSFTQGAGGFKQEFIIIDDVGGSDNEKDAEAGAEEEQRPANDIGADIYDSDYIDEDEIEALLDENLKNKKIHTDREFQIHEKIILVEYQNNPFDILPEGWVQVCHHNGMFVYLHRQTRVCTMSRPYFLGPGSVRRHDVPTSAIPCLQYRRSLAQHEADRKRDNIPDASPAKPPTGASPNLQSHEISQSDHAAQATGMEVDQSESVSQVTKMDASQLVNGTDLEDKSKEGESNDELDALAPHDSTPSTRAPSPTLHESTPSTRTPSTRAASPTLQTLEQSDATNHTQLSTEGSSNSAEQATVGGESTLSAAQDNSTTEQERLKAILAGDIAIGKKAECPFKKQPTPHVKSMEEHTATQTLSVQQVQEYCGALFEFKKISVKRFKSWGARHKHRKESQAAYKNAHMLPAGTQVLTCDIVPKEKDKKMWGKKRGEFVLNLKGKNDVCILHEYAQHVLRVHPLYEFKETANAEKPFCTSITINGITYGMGSAVSKKLAKSAAARDALNVLLPEVAKIRAGEKGWRSDPANEFAFFDEIRIEDPRILDLSSKSGQPLPFSILQECLKRNFGMGDTNIQMVMHVIRPQKSQFTMTVAQYEGKVMCKSKKEGKHMASQMILQKMHPHIKSWGSILRIYARDIEAVKMKQASKDSVTRLQSKANLRPNLMILSKLKDQMNKIHTVRKQVESSVRGHLEMPSLVLRSRLHLENLDLMPE